MSHDFASAFVRGLGLPDAAGDAVLVHNRGASVMLFVTRGGAPRYVVKLARRPEDSALVEAEHETLLKLRQRLAGHGRLADGVPAPILAGRHEGRAFLVTEWLRGRKDLLFGFDAGRAGTAVAWLTALHRETATVSVFGRELLVRYVDRYAGPSADAALPGELRALLDETVDGFGDRAAETVPVAFTHNDVSAANILFDDRGGMCVVDWGAATEQGFLFLDVLDLALYLVNHELNDYPESLRRLAAAGGAREGELRRLCRGYAGGFNLSDGMLASLLRVFFLSKACRFHRAGRPERVQQLIACFRASRDVAPCFGERR